jgi:hypothetical protein
VKIYTTKDWCQHPDGSFLSFAKIISDDDNEDDSIYTFQRKKTVIIHISSDFEYQCYYNIDIKEDWDTTKHICCSDTGNVVMSVKRELRLYRISSGSLQFIKSRNMEFYCSSISYFKNKIYCFTDEESLILDTNLNIKRKIEHFGISDNILPCSLQKYISTLESDDFDNYIICEDSRLKQLKYLRKEGFLPLCMCAATKDSVFVFGRQGEDFRILQVNTDLTVHTEIFVDEKEIDRDYMFDEKVMLFDQNNSRLVLPSDYDELTFLTIYLE